MAPKTIARPSIMLVDAGGSLLRVFQRYMHEVDIIHVESIEESIQSFTENPCHLIIINNPDVWITSQQIPTVEFPYPVPIVLCSVPEIAETNTKLGVSDYLVKPIGREALLEAVERYKLLGNKILIVDDEPDALRLYRRMLASSQKGYRVLRARDGQEALNISREELPDLLLIDLVMPNVDGYQFLKERSQDEKLCKIPVIITSARDPLSQPIISTALAVTQQGGLSIHHLLQFIRLTSSIFPLQERSTDQAGLQASPD